MHHTRFATAVPFMHHMQDNISLPEQGYGHIDFAADANASADCGHMSNQCNARCCTNVCLCCTRYFAVAEKSRHGAPTAYIYQYPSLAIEQTLEHGTERAYSAAAFNAAGDRLATVGSYPDFMLTVWDWKSGCTLLRSKAFSQEVYCVSFCPSSDAALVTSGIFSASQLRLDWHVHVHQL